MEGVYGWIAVNYMLGKFDHDFYSEPNRQSTVGALDMGGASTQITYEVGQLVEGAEGREGGGRGRRGRREGEPWLMDGLYNPALTPTDY